MSIAAVTARHTITILSPTEVSGAQMGRSTVYAAATPPVTRTCTVVPAGGKGLLTDLMRQKGVMQLYTLYFAANPHINETVRLQWENTVLRVVGLPRNAHGQDRLWIVKAEAHTDDNAGVEIE